MAEEGFVYDGQNDSGYKGEYKGIGYKVLPNTYYKMLQLWLYIG